MKILIASFISLVFVGVALADDPGVRDSLIMETVHAELGDTLVEVPMYITCDDSVVFYNMPFAWYSPDSAINPFQVLYHGVLFNWEDLYDSTLLDQGFIRMLGWNDISGDENPPIFTQNYRQHLWTLQFSIDSSAIPQIVNIDSTYDPINGPLMFGLAGGVQVLTPEFTPGAIFYGITTEISDMTQPLPQQLTLYQNYPNPFNAFTVIRYYLPDDGHASVTMYDLLGRKVMALADAEEKAGTHSVTFKDYRIPSGIYFYVLRYNGQIITRKMQFLK
jgi:hypothetical protein